MPEKIYGYMPSVAAFGLATFNVTITKTLEFGLQITGLLLAVAGFIHLIVKIQGSRLDNKIKQKQLDDD